MRDSLVRGKCDKTMPIMHANAYRSITSGSQATAVLFGHHIAEQRRRGSNDVRDCATNRRGSNTEEQVLEELNSLLQKITEVAEQKQINVLFFPPPPAPCYLRKWCPHLNCEHELKYCRIAKKMRQEIRKKARYSRYLQSPMNTHTLRHDGTLFTRNAWRQNNAHYTEAAGDSISQDIYNKLKPFLS